jgi:hypothetical protein
MIWIRPGKHFGINPLIGKWTIRTPNVRQWDFGEEDECTIPTQRMDRKQHASDSESQQSGHGVVIRKILSGEERGSNLDFCFVDPVLGEWSNHLLHPKAPEDWRTPGRCREKFARVRFSRWLQLSSAAGFVVVEGRRTEIEARRRKS